MGIRSAVMDNEKRYILLHNLRDILLGRIDALLNGDKQYARCPACGGKLKWFSENELFRSYLCEICGAYFRTNVREQSNVASIGDHRIIVDDHVVLRILRKD